MQQLTNNDDNYISKIHTENSLKTLKGIVVSAKSAEIVLCNILKAKVKEILHHSTMKYLASDSFSDNIAILAGAAAKWLFPKSQLANSMGDNAKKLATQNQMQTDELVRALNIAAAKIDTFSADQLQHVLKTIKYGNALEALRYILLLESNTRNSIQILRVTRLSSKDKDSSSNSSPPERKNQQQGRYSKSRRMSY